MQVDPVTQLPAPAQYFPISGGRYSTRAGLSRFGMDLGNAELDRQVFQFDNTFRRYHDNKRHLRTRLDDYVCAAATTQQTRQQAARFILERLCNEHPDLFSLVDDQSLHCHLTGHTVRLDATGDLLDALAVEIQEDLCIMAIDNGKAVLVAANLCAPNHWAAPDKLGMDMSELHASVPGFAAQNRRPDALLQGILDKQQPRVRFAWGLQHGDELDRHPRKAETHPGNLTMRIERQVLWPIPGTHSLLFTIRTLFRDCAELKQQSPGDFAQLVDAISHMDEATLRYKNIDREIVLAELESM